MDGIHIDSKTETSALAQALNKLAYGIENIKSSSDMDKHMVAELKRTVSDHDKAIVLMAKAVEDMNKNSAEMTSVFKEFKKESTSFQQQIQSEQIKHWQAQDKIMSKVEIILEGMAKNETRFSKIEDRQLTGCPSFLSFQDKRNSQMQNLEEIKKFILDTLKQNSEDIAELSETLKVTVEQVKVSNKRTTDLEAASLTHTKDFTVWKEGVYKALIGYAVAIIGAIIAGIWGVVSK